MKRLFTLFLLTTAMLVFWAKEANAQCTNTTAYGSVTAPTVSGTPVTVNCQYGGEYHPLNGAAAATQYTVTSTVPTDFITVRSGTSAGPVVAFGVQPLTFTTSSAGTYYTHVNTNASCGTASACRNVSTWLGLPPLPPANDLCASALPIACGQTVAGTTVNATADGAPLCTTAASAAGGVWYTLVGDGSLVTLSMCTGTSYDSKLFVYTGSCGVFTCVIGNDDFCGLQSQVEFAALAGTTYYILVAGFGTATGAFSLSASCITLPPPVTNDECSTAISLAVPSCGTYSTVGATDSPDPGPLCTDNEFGASYYTGGDVWFSFVMPPSGWVTLTGDNITFFAFIGGTPIAPLGIEIYSGDCAAFGGGGASAFCDQAQATAGFPSDLPCQTSVCSYDSYCCTTNWDGICAGEAATDPNCANCLSSTSSVGPEQCAIIWDNQADQMLFQGNPGQSYIVRVWDLFSPPEQEGFDLCIEETQPTIASCNATFTDSGGAAGPYQDLERKYYIICGDTPYDDIAKVTFNEFSIESGFDFMTVWDAFGPVGTPLDGPDTGTAWEGTTFEATNPSGCLTFFFESDNIITDLGWNADVRCVCKQTISVPAAYTDFLCSGETPDFTAAAASIQYTDLQGNPADGSEFTIKWFLNAAWTQPAPPNLTLDYVGTGCNPQPTILFARGTCSTGEFFDAGFMTAIVYPTPEAPQIVLINSGPVCSYAYLPAACPATSFSPATPPNETVGNPPTGTTVQVTSTNGGCSVTYDVVKPTCDACYIPTTITGSACEGLPADFASFEASLNTGGVAGLGAVNWYYDASYTNMVNEAAPLNIEIGGCAPTTVTLYAMGTCLSGAMQPAGQITLTYYPAPEAPTVVALDFFCNYGYAAPACPGTTFLTELSPEDPGDGGQTVSVDVLANGCVYTFDVVKPVCQVCELEADFTLIYEAGTGASAFFNYGTIDITSEFSTPLSYQWDIDGYVTYGVPAPGTINVLYTDESVFYVTITDATGCRTVVTNLETSIDDLSIINAVITPDNGSSTGAVNITVAGGDAPFTYAWQGPNGFAATTEDISGLIVGWYIVSITSADGQSAFGWFWVPKQTRGRGKTDESASIMAYPNPVMDNTNIAFSVAETTDATVTLHSISGQQVGQLYKGIVNGGETITLPFNASGLPAGIYFARLTTANGEMQNYKLVVGQ